MKVTVCIPTKNEAQGIKQIIAAVSPYADEVLVVDGHSQDQTRALAEQADARVIVDNKKGKGDGLRLGLRNSSGEIVVFMDADGSHDARDIPKLITPIREGKADLVIASRAKGGSDEFHMRTGHLVRQWGSDLAALVINTRWKADLTDVQNGFRAIRRCVALRLCLEANDFDIEQEMVMKTLKHGYRIVEIASHESSRGWGSSKLPTSKAWKFLYRLIKELL